MCPSCRKRHGLWSSQIVFCSNSSFLDLYKDCERLFIIYSLQNLRTLTQNHDATEPHAKLTQNHDENEPALRKLLKMRDLKAFTISNKWKFQNIEYMKYAKDLRFQQLSWSTGSYLECKRYFNKKHSFFGYKRKALLLYLVWQYSFRKTMKKAFMTMKCIDKISQFTSVFSRRRYSKPLLKIEDFITKSVWRLSGSVGQYIIQRSKTHRSSGSSKKGTKKWFAERIRSTYKQ